MAFNHRKLLPDPTNTTQFCSPYCEPTNTNICPFICISQCFSTCPPLPYEIPPPPPPPDYLLSPSDNSPHKKNNSFPLSLTLSLSLLAFTLSLLLCYIIYKFYTKWKRSRQRTQPQPQSDETHDDFLDEDHGPVVDHPIWYIRTVGLNPSVISAITICKYKKSEGLVEGTECSVCLNEFQEDETLRLLPKCNHAFHIPCIDTWLRSHTNCPMCRAGIVSNLAGSPSPEPIVGNLSPVEEPQLGNSQNNRELGGETEDEDHELRIGIQEEGDNGIKTEEIPKEVLGSIGNSQMDEIQPMRRSVSLDSLSAAMISAAIVNASSVPSDRNSNTQMVKLKESNKGVGSKRVGSSSIGRSLQKGPISIGRSFSYSGKVLLSRHSRSRNSGRLS